MNRIDSYLSPKCEVRESRIGEFGVFAKEMLVAHELVAVFGGKIYSHQEIGDLALVCPRLATHPVSVNPQFSLGPADPNAACDDTERFNHSCDPNIGIPGQIVLLVRRDIATDEELCFDYDTTEIAPPQVSLPLSLWSEEMPWHCRWEPMVQSRIPTSKSRLAFLERLGTHS